MSNLDYLTRLEAALVEAQHKVRIHDTHCIHKDRTFKDSRPLQGENWGPYPVIPENDKTTPFGWASRQVNKLVYIKKSCVEEEVSPANSTAFKTRSIPYAGSVSQLFTHISNAASDLQSNESIDIYRVSPEDSRGFKKVASVFYKPVNGKDRLIIQFHGERLPGQRQATPL